MTYTAYVHDRIEVARRRHQAAVDSAWPLHLTLQEEIALKAIPFEVGFYSVFEDQAYEIEVATEHLIAWIEAQR